MHSSSGSYEHLTNVGLAVNNERLISVLDPGESPSDSNHTTKPRFDAVLEVEPMKKSLVASLGVAGLIAVGCASSKPAEKPADAPPADAAAAPAADAAAPAADAKPAEGSCGGEKKGEGSCGAAPKN